MKITRWMKAIITAQFYIKCEIHPEQSETKFCKDCITSFCPDCNSIHLNHKTLTVYKASKAVAVRTKDLNNESLDSSDICDYSINNRNIYFVHKKSHRSSSSSSSSNNSSKLVTNVVGGASQVAECEVCCYRLVKPDRRFCSVECKVAALEQEMMRAQQDENIVDRKTSTTVFTGIRSSKRRRIRKQLKPSRAPSF